MTADPAPPVVLAVDPDPALLAELLQDLRADAGGAEVWGALTGADALGLLADAARDGRRVALMAVAQTPDQPADGPAVGLALLELSRRWFPAAKRLLLGDASAPAVARALADELIHDAVGRPWRPAATTLAPVVHDLLDEWASLHRGTARQIVVVGDGSAASHRVREMFSRNPVPHLYFDAADPDGARAVERHRTIGQPDAPSLPLVVTADGRALWDPAPAALWEALGERTGPCRPAYDVVIAGAGPAGLAAAVASASEGLDTLVVEPIAPGGQAGSSSRIENYVGFPGGVTGTELGRRAYRQALRLGAEFIGPQRVERIGRGPGDDRTTVTLDSGQQVRARAVVVATGLRWNRLDVPGADRFEGRGLYYGAATSEARAAAGRDVHVVGGANSAGQAALFFARVARSVTVVVRGESLNAGMSAYLVDRLGRLDNVRVLLRSSIVAADGDADRLRAVRIRDASTERERDEPTDAVFCFIGARPDTDWLPDEVKRDNSGFVLTGPAGPAASSERSEHATGMDGIFAVGDVRHGTVKRVSSAVGDGSAAVPELHAYLASAPAPPSAPDGVAGQATWPTDPAERVVPQAPAATTGGSAATG